MPTTFKVEKSFVDENTTWRLWVVVLVWLIHRHRVEPKDEYDDKGPRD